MPGLTDSITGLQFGEGLQWGTPIGGAGLDIVVSGDVPATAMLYEDGTAMLYEDGTYMLYE